MPNIIDNISDRIRQVRETLKESQKGFACILGISRQTMWEYENRRLPSCEILIKIADIGDVSLDWLLTGKESKWYTNELLRELEEMGIKTKEDMESFKKILQGYMGIETYRALVKLMEQRRKL